MWSSQDPRKYCNQDNSVKEENPKNPSNKNIGSRTVIYHLILILNKKVLLRGEVIVNNCAFAHLPSRLPNLGLIQVNPSFLGKDGVPPAPIRKNVSPSRMITHPPPAWEGWGYPPCLGLGPGRGTLTPMNRQADRHVLNYYLPALLVRQFKTV